MTPTEQLAVSRLIDDLEEAHHDRDDKRFNQLTSAARELMKSEEAPRVTMIKENHLVYYSRSA